MPRNIRLTIEYDGSAYSGWQSQINALSIQDVMEGVLATLCGQKTRLFVSGRTDAGVHAIRQVANFFTDSTMSDTAFVRGFNALLPADIVVKAVSEVGPDFHARHSTEGKTYRYLLYNTTVPSALLRNHSWHIRKELDVGAMREAAGHLLGRHDFSAFRASSCSAAHAVREVRTLNITTAAPDMLPFSMELPPLPPPVDGPRLVIIETSADAFLKQMVRNIVGTLVEVGKDKVIPRKVKDILEGKDRRAAGPTAPPQGLFLVKVDY